MKNRSLDIPYIGQRIVKTGIAVFLCLVVYYLLGYRGQSVPAEAGITAIICMQPYVRDTREYALNRVLGTLIGTFWGLAMLLVFYAVPSIGSFHPLLYLCMAFGIMLALYSAVLLHKADASGLAAIVCLCIVIAYPDIESPLKQAALRVMDVFLGTFIAIMVNIARFPRKKNSHTVFFVRSADLAPDRLSRMAASVEFRLGRLIRDGARLCLQSEHAPAFFTEQLSSIKLGHPMIVMDGAAIFDPSANIYLWKRPLSKDSFARLEALLDGMGLSYYIYTIHRGKTCIFHKGWLRDEERTVLRIMRRSPYRNYLEGEILDPAEAVYIKIIVSDEKEKELLPLMKAWPEAESYRFAVRAQAGAPGICAIYIYDAEATVKAAEAVLLKQLLEEDPAMKAFHVYSENGYHTEHDALRVLSRIERKYEPFSLSSGRKQEKQ